MNLRIRVIYGLSCFLFTGILLIYKNRYTPLNTVTYWLVSLFVTFEINFGSNSLEGLHLVFQGSHTRRCSTLPLTPIIDLGLFREWYTHGNTNTSSIFTPITI